MGEVITRLPSEERKEPRVGIHNFKEMGKARFTPKRNQDVWRSDASCYRIERQLTVRNKIFTSETTFRGVTSFQ